MIPTPLVNCYRAADDRWFWLIGLEADRHLPGVLAAVGRPELAEDVEESAKRAVVMVQCSTPDVERPGAGILLGKDAAHVYIVTAAHVVIDSRELSNELRK